MDKTNKPDLVLRDGSLKATVWRNEGENGPYFSTKLAKTYSDQDGKPRDTQNFSQSELLRVAELSRDAYGAINDLKREQSRSQGIEKSTQPAQSDDAERSAFKETRRAQSAQNKQQGFQR